MRNGLLAWAGAVSLGGALIGWAVGALAAGVGLAVPWVAEPVVVDGVLSEEAWSQRDSWASLAWDEEYLYFAAQVRDASVEVSDDYSRDFRGSDRVLWVISRAIHAGSRSDPLGRDDFAFVFTPDSRYRRALKTVYGFGGFEHLEFDLRQVTVEGRRNPGMYTLEARVAWPALGLVPHAGLRLRTGFLALEAGSAEAGVGRRLLRPAVLVLR